MSTHRPNGFSALASGLSSGLQWRPLLWWVLALAVPTLLASLPMWIGLNAKFAHSVHTADIAAGRDVPLLLEGFMAASEASGAAIGLGMMVALVLSALLSPWLTGMVVAQQRAGRRLELSELAHGGLSEYWRMFRMLLWSLLPLGAALALGAAAMGWAESSTADAILESDVARAMRLALAACAVLFAIAHATVEAARGWLGAAPGLRSVLRAWWRGTKLVLRRPLASLVVYLGTTAAGFVLAAAFAWLRLRLDGAGFGSFLLGLLLTQLVVAALAWGRIARLHGFAALASGRIEEAAAKAAAEEVAKEAAEAAPVAPAAPAEDDAEAPLPNA